MFSSKVPLAKGHTSLRIHSSNMYSSSKIFLLTVPRRCFFCRSFVLFMSCVCHAFASVHCCLVVTCWERADLLFVMFYYVCVTFPCGIFGQVWYLIVSISDLCRLSYLLSKCIYLLFNLTCATILAFRCISSSVTQAWPIPYPLHSMQWVTDWVKAGLPRMGCLSVSIR